MAATEVVTEGAYMIWPCRVNNRYEITEPIYVTWGPIAPKGGESRDWLYMEFRFNQDCQERPQIEPIRTFGKEFETIRGKMEQMLASTWELVHLQGPAADTDPVLAKIKGKFRFIRPLYKVSAPSVNGH